MKRIIYFATVILFAAVMGSGCTKELTTAVEDGEMVLVNLQLAGEIGIEETPLTKAFTSNDLIGVQVYQGGDYYAYGLFDDVSKMSIYLHSGQSYKFVCTVVKGKGECSSWSSSDSYFCPLNAIGIWAGFNRGDYPLPFIRKTEDKEYRIYHSGGYEYKILDHAGTSLDNAFVYSSTNYFTYLQYGVTGWQYSPKYHSGGRFYGEVSNYRANGNGSLTIPLKRVGFGLTVSVSGITDGDVSVTISNSEQTFANYTGIATDTQFPTTYWSFFDLKSAWQYADNYAENFTVGVVWNRVVGVTQDLGTKLVQLKRNAVNHVKINLSTTTKSSDLAIILEEPEIINETYSFGN